MTEQDTALVWDQAYGYMLCNGVRMTLYEAPLVPGLHRYSAIVYQPQTGQTRVLRDNRWHEMSSAEATVIEAWLHRWADGSRNAVHAWDGRERRRK